MVLEYGASSSSLTIMKGGAALDVGVGTRSGFDGVAGFCMMAQLLVNQRFILIANSTETSTGNGCELVVAESFLRRARKQVTKQCRE